MTEQEAIKIFNTIKAFGKCHLVGNEKEELFEVVYKSLQKQTPKKIKIQDKSYLGYNGYLINDSLKVCPSCNTDLTPITNKYEINACPMCGQKLDWSEEEMKGSDLDEVYRYTGRSS